MAKKRDAAYLKGRLKRDHPASYKALEDGRIPSVRQAAAAAGLIHLPTRLDALKREWKKATAAEQADFERWRVGPTGAARRARAIADSTGRLTSDAVKFLMGWKKSRGITAGQILKEMGRKNFDWRLEAAIGRGYPLKDEVLTKLDPWMRKNGY